MKIKIYTILLLVPLLFSYCSKECDHAITEEASIVKFDLAKGDQLFPVIIRGTELILDIENDIDPSTLSAHMVLSEGAVISPDPSSISDWSESAEFIVTSANETVQTTYTYSKIDKQSEFTYLFKTQEEVNAFAELGYTDVYSIRIQSSDIESEKIKDISAFNSIKNIRSLLHISAFYGKEFNGFQNLENVSTIEIISDSVKTNTVKFPKLESVTNMLFGRTYSDTQQSYTCDSIKVVECKMLTEIKGDFIMSASITDFSGFPKLEKIGGQVLLQTLGKNLKGLENLKSIDRIVIGGANLESLEGLEGLKSINSHLEIAFARNITSLKGLENLEVLGNLNINNTQSLTDISALSKITTIEGIYINGVAKLSTLEGLHNIEEITGALTLGFVGQGSFMDPTIKKLENLQGLRSLKTIGRTFSINQSSLINFDGLQNLTSVGAIYFRGLSKVTSLTGLNNLTSCKEQFSFENSLIESVSELSSLEEAGSFLFKGNRNLKWYCAIKDIVADGSSLNFTCLNNAYNPTYQDMVDGKCHPEGEEGE